jgi:hypothetical protein
MRRFPARLILLLWGAGALAQQPTTDPAAQSPTVPVIKPSTDEPEDRVRKDNRQPLPTPLEEREIERRKFDPFDPTVRDDDQSAEDKEKEKEKEEREAEQRRDSDRKPLPGSIAADEAHEAAAKNGGPRVVGDDDADAQAPQYTGPAVLSHSYTLSSGLIPDDLTWREFFGVSSVYDTGLNAAATGPQGQLLAPSGPGFNFSWGISGRHKFHRDSLGVSYTGGRPWYSQGDQYAGLTNRLIVDYTHVVSSRLFIKFTGTGAFLSQSSALGSLAQGPVTSVADINTAATPTAPVYDSGSKTFTTGVNVSWQQSARLSFTAGASYFVTMYRTPGLIGMGGEQFQANMNYRLTSQTTAGIFYSYSMYVFQSGQGTTNSYSIGGLFSHSFNRSTRLQLRAGGGTRESLELQPVPLNPLSAALFGLTSEIVDGYQKSFTEDISASLTKDFGSRETASVSYSKGVTPGNGLILAGTSETISATTSLRVFGRYAISASMGRQSITSTLGTESLSNVIDFFHVSSSRPLNHSMTLNFGADYRYYQISQFAGLRNEVSLNCGFMWNRTERRLWPLW